MWISPGFFGAPIRRDPLGQDATVWRAFLKLDSRSTPALMQASSQTNKADGNTAKLVWPCATWH